MAIHSLPKSAARPLLVGNDRDQRQAKLAEWAAAAFGPEHAASIPQRGVRMLEEAIEAAQAAGVDLAMAHKLLDFVYARPVGDLRQELGGLALTTLLLAHSAGTSAEAEERRELERVMSKAPEHFRARNEAKNAAGFNLTAQPTTPPKWLDYYLNVGPSHLTPEACAECERWLDAHKHK